MEVEKNRYYVKNISIKQSSHKFWEEGKTSKRKHEERSQNIEKWMKERKKEKLFKFILVVLIGYILVKFIFFL